MGKLKIAIVHDYIKEYGGAERVLEVLHEMYPDAPVYTLIYAPQFLGPHQQRFKSWNIKPSFLQYIPWSYKFISIYRLLAPFVFPLFNFSAYDAVIVSATGAYSPNTIRIKNQSRFNRDQESRIREKNNKPLTINHKPVHICYYHTPPRYLYGLPTARKQTKNKLLRILTLLMVHFLRKIDVASSKHVDIAIANSENVKARIKKWYNKDAVVVYPPVDINSKFKVQSSKLPERYFLAGGRLARPKHIDLIIKACMKLGVPLKIFGKGFAGYEIELRSITNVRHSGEWYATTPESLRDPGRTSFARMTGGVELLGEVTDEERNELMKNATAFIFAAEDEDFGIIPVEAMGVGTPVIAYNSGGVKETVVGGKTGIFFNELTVGSLKHALMKFETMTFSTTVMVKQAEKFSKEKFVEKMREIITDSLQT